MDLGSLGTKAQEAQGSFKKRSTFFKSWGQISNLLGPGSRRISALLSYQESPKVEICGD